MTEVQAKRFDGERNYYDAPCCGVTLAIFEDTAEPKCPCCGAWLEQNGIGLSLKARVRTHFETDGCNPPEWIGPKGE